ncbi:MAG: hypothetical protein WAK17_19805 [Candidatus Nitrosopolaris sp.]|jgi:hypothetical protein
MVINQYNVRKGMEYGAFAGFIASIAFIGVMLWLPLILSLPVGVFLHALGLSVITPIVNGDAVHVGLVAFGLVLAQGVLVGIIFGMVTSKIKRLHIYDKRKGVALGLATGVIAYLVLFVTVALTIYPALLTSALTKYPQTILFSLQGTHAHITTIPGSYLSMILGYGLFAYLIYGFILGGILVWTYSVYNYVFTKLAHLEKNGNKTKTKTNS